MSSTPYIIHRINRRTKAGITSASLCTLNAVLKFDCDESSYCVYNEHVAVRLAQTLHLPVMDGVLASTNDGPAFASLEIATIGLPLPNMLESQIAKAENLYPNEAAALVAFDIFIGNGDRARNLKASLSTPHIKIFKAFDHSHCLLNIEGNPVDSLKRLADDTDLIAQFHPFYGHIKKSLLNDWAARISALDDVYIQECCSMGKTFRAVTVDMQKGTAAALIKRKNALPAIIAMHSRIIDP